jgi:Kinesin motor domain
MCYTHYTHITVCTAYDTLLTPTYKLTCAVCCTCVTHTTYVCCMCCTCYTHIDTHAVCYTHVAYTIYIYHTICRQTGAGKSFTMEGTPSNPGVNTRALAALFELAAARTTDVEYRSVIVTLSVTSFTRYCY